MIFRIFVCVFVFVGCTGLNTHHNLSKLYEKTYSDDWNSSYAFVAKNDYERLYHNTQNTKHHLDTTSNQEIAHTDYYDSIEFIWPTSGVLTSTFGIRTLRHRTQMHTGIDIGTHVGTPVYASETGRVVFSGVKKGYGKVIILRHDKRHETLYGHLSRMIIKQNQIVHRNQLIGYVGKTGRVTGANLHFETRINGVAKDPLNFLPSSFYGDRRVHVGEFIAPYHRYHVAKSTEQNNQKI